MIGVTKHHRQQKGYPDGLIVFEIDTEQATYRGAQLRDLGPTQRRKFENMIFIEGAGERLPMKFVYH